MCTNKRFLEETVWLARLMAEDGAVLVAFFFFTGFPLFSQEAIACDTRQGTRRLFFPNGSVWLFCFLGLREYDYEWVGREWKSFVYD
jgi:hypothetical protein